MTDPTLALRRQPRDSLATKIIFFVFFSTFVTALVVSWISVQSTYAFLRSHLDASYPLLLDRAAGRLETGVAEGQAALDALAGDPALTLLVSGERIAAADARRRLAEFAAAQPAFAGLLVTDAAGELVTSESDVVLPADQLPREPGVHGVADQLMASTLVRDARGDTIGAVHGVFAPDALRALLGATRSSAEAPLYLVNANGSVLLGTAPVDAAGFEAFPRDLLARPDHPAAFDFRSADGRRGIGAHRPLSVAGWGVVVAEPLEVAFAPVFSVVTRVFVIDLAIILAFSFLAYEITAKIVRPLEALSDGARGISRGELEIEIADTGTHDEIGLLTRTFNDMARRLRRNRDEIDHQHGQLREQNEELQRANEVLEQLSITDGLTKLHNHRYFQEALTREIKRVSRSGEPLAILLVDIDDFKGLNDRHGHAHGDTLLVRIARVLNESVRESDILARYGGEEFVVLATGTDLEGAMFVAEKVRTAVAETIFVAPETLEPMRVTVSIGVAEFAGDRKRFFDAADRALYRAKGAGKNCVMAAAPGDRA
jgi:diguanylate cyclase (GGDEF)-like protein